MEKLDSFLKNKKVQLAFLIFTLVFLTVFAVRHYVRHVRGYADESIKIVRIMTDNMPFETLEDGSTLTQEFSVAEAFQGFSIRMGALQADMQGAMEVTLLNDKEEKVYAWKYQLKDMNPLGFINFTLPEDVTTTKGAYKIVCKMENDSAGKFVYYRTPSDVFTGWNCTLNDVAQPWDIEISVFKNNTSHYYSYIGYFYWGMFFIICALIIGVTFFGIRKKCKIEFVFLAYMMVFGFIYMFVLPPYSAPDEIAHFGTAYDISNRFCHLGSDTTDVTMRLEDASSQYRAIPNIDTYDYTKRHMFQHASQKELTVVGGMRIYTSNHTTHFIAGIGIFIGKILGWGNVPTTYLGRMFNLILYTLVVFFAIRIIPFGKMVLFSISVMPMMLQLACSYSYDAFINPLAFLTIALILKYIYDASVIRKRDILGLIILATLLGPCKIIYSCIFLLCIFIPRIKFKNKIHYSIAIIGIALGILLPNVYYNFAIIKNMVGKPQVEQSVSAVDETANTAESTDTVATSETTQTEGVVETTETAQTAIANSEYYTATWCIHHPWETIKLYVRTSVCFGVTYVMGTIGKQLGWIEIGIPSYFILGLGLLLFLSFFEKNKYSDQIKMKHRIVTFFVFFVVYVLAHASMLFGWTSIKSNLILGVQGRYFIPALPVFVVLFSNKKASLPKSIRNYLFVSYALLQFIVITQIMLIICQR